MHQNTSRRPSWKTLFTRGLVLLLLLSLVLPPAAFAQESPQSSSFREIVIELPVWKIFLRIVRNQEETPKESDSEPNLTPPRDTER